MVKLIALFREPEDVEAFDRRYFDIHLPLVRAIPGLERVEITRITGSPIGGPAYRLMSEMYYSSADAMDAANASPEGRAASRDLLAFAPDLLTILTGETES